jgi:hypothetical protein
MGLVERQARGQGAAEGKCQEAVEQTEQVQATVSSSGKLWSGKRTRCLEPAFLFTLTVSTYPFSNRVFKPLQSFFFLLRDPLTNSSHPQSALQ